MTGQDTRTRKTLLVAGAVLVPLAIALTWAVSGAFSPSPDDPSELLRRAGASKAEGVAKPTGKVIEAKVVTSAGTPVHVHMPEIRDGSGRLGYGLHLDKALKPGESASVKMPGGGSVMFGVPKDGQPPRIPGSNAKPASR